MAEALSINCLRNPLVDPDTGIPTRDGFLFLAGLWTRGGGAIAQNNSELMVDMFDDAGIEELKSGQYGQLQDLSQNPGSQNFYTAFDDVIAEMRALQDVVAELIKRVDGMQQGNLAL